VIFGGFRLYLPKKREVAIFSFVVIKVLLLFFLWQSFDFSPNLASTSEVFAEEEASQADNNEGQPSEETAESESEDPDDLLRSIQRERDALKNREDRLKTKEEQLRQREVRIERVQIEIEEKLETLHLIQATLQELIQEKRILDNEILKKLAKVYESTPPEQAGPMLEQLDVKLAAKILIRMDGRKAGKIWGYVTPEKASQISTEISSLE
jgi:flagellar motility protein MotE (MotC chaperone)